MTSHSKGILILTAFLISSAGAQAGEADVVGAHVTLTAPDTFRFDVTVSHADEGWEHYANAFEILDSEGNILGTRELLHPHVNEQPFTRTLANVMIPKRYYRRLQSVPWIACI